MPRRHTILLVDDEPDQCEVHEAVLRRAGHKVRSTTSPLEALTLLDDVALVVTDVQMSEMNGLELCRRVQVVAPHALVIILTGLGNFDAAVAALRAGAFDFLLKPIDPKLLIAAARRAVDERSRRSAAPSSFDEEVTPSPSTR